MYIVYVLYLVGCCEVGEVVGDVVVECYYVGIVGGVECGECGECCVEIV